MTVSTSNFSHIQKDAEGHLHLIKRIYNNSVDYSEIIKATEDIKTEKTVEFKDKIKIRTEQEIPAIEVLRDKLNILKKSLESLTNDTTAPLRNSSGLSNGIDIRTAKIKSTDDAVSILVSSSAQVTSNDFSINVYQKATKDKIVTNYSASTLTQEVGFSGNLSINNVLIDISTTDTLNDIVSKINLKTEDTGVSASTIQTTEFGGHKLVLESIEFVKPINFQGTDSTISGDQGLCIPVTTTDVSDLIAKFKFDNIDIERNSNVITNLMDGVTINLNSVSTKDTVFSVEHHKEAAYLNITQFVDAYNDVVKTMAKYSDDQDGKNKEAVLKDNAVIVQIKHMLHSSKNIAGLGGSSTSSSLLSLGDLGITFVSGQSGNNDEVEGMLLIDQGTLVTKIMNGDYKNVVKLFGDYAEFSNSEFNIAKFPEKLNPAILGKEISIDYALVGASSTDETFSANFSIPKPRNDFFDSDLVGKTVDLSLQRDGEGNYSVLVSGVSGISSITSASVVNNVISFPDDSYLAGVTINFIGDNIQNGTSLQTSVTLPDVVVTLSSSGNADLTIYKVQSGYIECPSDSIYSGINILFEPKSSTLVMGGSGIKSKMVLTQGIAKDFAKEITAATKRKVGLETPTSLFDVAVSNIKQLNETDERKIESLNQSWENKKKHLESLLAVLYAQDERFAQILNMIDIWTGKKSDH